MLHHPAILKTKHIDKHLLKLGVDNSACLVWGRKPLSRLMTYFANVIGRECISLEDGFISYFGHPAYGSDRFSLVSDKKGIYYDATRPSDLETLIVNRAKYEYFEQPIMSYLDNVSSNGIGKYYMPIQHDSHESLNSVPCGSVLLVDQVHGDMSLKYGMCKSDVAEQMYLYAVSLVSQSGGDVYLKLHPDVLSNKKGARSLFRELIKSRSDIKTLDSSPPLSALSQKFKSVVTATSQFGFQALMSGLEVHCFGAPFYSHWGLTHDVNEIKSVTSRRKALVTASLLDLFAASYVDYASYVCPVSGASVELDAILKYLLSKEINS